MFYVEKINIQGFWGDRDFDLNFDPYVNLFIGVNGSGKTTLINLIAAALEADFLALDKLPFQEIEITLKHPTKRNKPKIQVRKLKRRSLPFPNIQYRIRESGSVNWTSYSLDDSFEQRHLRGVIIPSKLRQRNLSRVSSGVLEHISKLVETSWLSIHRSTAARDSSEESSYNSSIDRKISNLNNELGKYFSSLTSQRDREDQRFQEFIFLSMLESQTANELFGRAQHFNRDQQQSALSNIFKELHVPESSFRKPMSSFFERAEKSAESLRSDLEGDTDDQEKMTINLDYIVNLVGIWRLDAIIHRWNELIERRNVIFQPRDTFLDVLNELLGRKKILVNDENEIYVETQSKKEFGPQGLSSGEKQLFILLGETLLQRDRTWVYIADEPELSLHITWQSLLIDSIRKLNPNVQTIFATHSPDIVGNYSNNVINMEDVLS